MPKNEPNGYRKCKKILGDMTAASEQEWNTCSIIIMLLKHFFQITLPKHIFDTSTYGQYLNWVSQYHIC